MYRQSQRPGPAGTAAAVKSAIADAGEASQQQQHLLLLGAPRRQQGVLLRSMEQAGVLAMLLVGGKSRLLLLWHMKLSSWAGLSTL